MTIATYAELVDEIEAWLNADYAARVPGFIALFEARMNRQLRAPAMEANSTATTGSGIDTYALPTDCIQMRALYIDGDPDTVLESMSLAALRDTFAGYQEGSPCAYAVTGSDLVLAPTPDQEYTLNLGYFQSIPGLTETNTTNWLLSAFPDAYLYGVLAVANAFLRDDVNAGQLKAAWDEVLAEMHRHFNRQRAPAGPLSLRPTVIE